ncbi:perilipin-3- hypothetical protein [Limosa lapponica baueri]|uniref:TIR domain-containing protein n=1 Tax=Limosa lapponica baueri TaxID=1758121 RepID=A0A2I0TL79_LIMLA|nr:perilipin-3- hypothetical protein [Limosa lapponica baueri]
MPFQTAAAEFSMASEKTTKKDLVKAEEQQQASVVDRVTSLPLLNSAFNLVSSAYNHTKETHPCLSGVCNVAETVAAVAVGSVVGGAQPILNQLEPQIASTITAAVGAAQSAKDLVTNTVTEAVDRTKGAVQDSVEKTKSMVASTVNTALDAAYGTISSKINTALEQSREVIQEGMKMTNSVVTNSISKAKAVSQAVAGGVESVLGISEDLVDHYLPMTEEELGELATSVKGFGVASVEEQKQQQSYFVRLGSLSSKVQQRAYQLSLNKLRCVKQSTQETLSRLQLTIKLIESVKQEVGQKLLDGQEKLHQLWVDWCLTQPKGNQVQTASQPEVESRTLAMLRIITQQLQPAYENLKASIHGLPSNIQEAVYQATRNIRKLHSSFSSAMSFQDLSSTTLTQSQDYVAEARRSLDDLFEYVTHNIPLNWLVGPFRAIAKVSQDSRKQMKKDTPVPLLLLLIPSPQPFHLLFRELFPTYQAGLASEPDGGDSKFFTFVVLHASEDESVAHRVKNLLEKMGVPNGATLSEDFFIAGRSHLTCFQDAMENSAFIILLLTKNFPCNLCIFQTNTALMESILNPSKRDSVIPFVPKENPLERSQLPSTLSGLMPLDENSPVFSRTVQNTFTSSRIGNRKAMWDRMQRKKLQQYQEQYQPLQNLAALNLGSHPQVPPPATQPQLLEPSARQWCPPASAVPPATDPPHPMPGQMGPPPFQPLYLPSGHYNVMPGPEGIPQLIIQNARMIQIGNHNTMQVEAVTPGPEDSKEETS